MKKIFNIIFIVTLITLLNSNVNASDDITDEWFENHINSFVIKNQENLYIEMKRKKEEEFNLKIKLLLKNIEEEIKKFK